MHGWSLRVGRVRICRCDRRLLRKSGAERTWAALQRRGNSAEKVLTALGWREAILALRDKLEDATLESTRCDDVRGQELRGAYGMPRGMQ